MADRPAPTWEAPGLPAEAIKAAAAEICDDRCVSECRDKAVRALEAARPHLAATFPRCPTACDDDCEQACHEVHQPTWKRDHNPETCVAMIVSAERAAQREEDAQLAEQEAASTDLQVASDEALIAGAVLRNFATRLRQDREGEG